MGTPKHIDINDQFKFALRQMETTHDHIFITGKAGTGKSTLLKYFRDHTQKSFVVLAPTGVAAVNIDGQTIHSFFKFRPNVSVDKVRGRSNPRAKTKTIYQKLHTIIIDEISMVRADLLDCIEKFMRLNGPVPGEAFGGVQLIFFGDLYQLPPVVRREDWEVLKNHYASPHFFSAKCIEAIDISLIELDRIYRQNSEVFIEILNSIRANTVTDHLLSHLNQTCFDAPVNTDKQAFVITLTGTNKTADAINTEALESIDEKYHLLEGELTGEFREDSLPSPQDLKLKPGAQIMLTNNDPKQRWINGTMGKVLRLSQTDDYETVIRVELDSGQRVNVTPNTWEMTKYVTDGTKIMTEVIGTYTQYPLKLAWAITVHKSQGKTFDNVIIDLGRSAFAAGQTYVALSRCRTLEGISLKQKITKRHIITDGMITNFLVSLKMKQAQAQQSNHEKVYRLGDAIESGSEVSIDYIRKNGDVSTRTIEPESIGSVALSDDSGIPIDTVKGYCHTAQKTMTFSIPQILRIHR